MGASRLAAPACALAVGLAVSLLLAAFGYHPMWPQAALRVEAEVVRLIGSGDDPNHPRDIRPGLLFDDAIRLTPLEAAVASPRAEMVERHVVRVP